jgi:hypothetical protein
MVATLVVPDPLLARLEAFVSAQGLPLAVATEPPTEGLALRVRLGDREQHADAEQLVAGGRVRCAVALGMAKRLGIPALGLGALLDELDIKVGSCSLGCF